MKGTACPIPVLRANRALRPWRPANGCACSPPIAPRSPTSRRSVRETGHALLAWSEENGVFSFVIRRRADEPEQKD